MFTKTIAVVAAVAALVPTGMAAAHPTIQNSCAETVCVYTTPAGGGPISGTYKIKPGDSRKFKYPAEGAAGSQLQISPNCSPHNTVYWEISQASGVVYYDVNIEGPTSDPFKQGLSVTGTSPSCPKISCAAGGSTSCFNAPNGQPQYQVKACDATNSITLHACKP